MPSDTGWGRTLHTSSTKPETDGLTARYIHGFFRKKEIWNCLPGEEKEGEKRTKLMTRWTLLSTPWGQLRLHWFHADDYGRDLHDHPWSFVSLILWGGYYEVVPLARNVAHLRRLSSKCWRRPGLLLIRPALWLHRVELKDSKSAITLIWMSNKVREWGFATSHGWVEWREYHAQNGCL
jgi:hypothetical protein